MASIKQNRLITLYKITFSGSTFLYKSKIFVKALLIKSYSSVDSSLELKAIKAASKSSKRSYNFSNINVNIKSKISFETWSVSLFKTFWMYRSIRLTYFPSYSYYLSNTLRHLTAECSIPIIISLAMLCSPTERFKSSYFKLMTWSKIPSISSIKTASIGIISYLFLIPVSGSKKQIKQKVYYCISLVR
jgi:hypothetical protein